MFLSENKFYDRKESSLTKYYCTKSKLTVIPKFLTFSFKEWKDKKKKGSSSSCIGKPTEDFKSSKE